MRGSVILGLVVGGHLALGAAILGDADEGEVATGGAPVINLTLTPRAQFDGAGASQESRPETSASGGGSTPPEVVSPRVPRPVPEGLAAEPAPPPPAIAPAPPAATGAPATASGPASGPGGSGRGSGQGAAAASPDGTTAGGGARTLGGAAAAEQDAYAATVIAWIERHKGRPRASLHGDVVLRFVLDRRGRLRDIGVMGSSGSRGLDRTALDAVQAAQPFPLPPAGSNWRTREFRVRIQYQPDA